MRNKTVTETLRKFARIYSESLTQDQKQKVVYEALDFIDCACGGFEDVYVSMFDRLKVEYRWNLKDMSCLWMTTQSGERCADTT